MAPKKESPQKKDSVTGRDKKADGKKTAGTSSKAGRTSAGNGINSLRRRKKMMEKEFVSGTPPLSQAENIEEEKKAGVLEPQSGALPPEEKKGNFPAEIEDDAMAAGRGDTPMSVVGHLDELRTRLIMALVTVLVITLAGFFLSDALLGFITWPVSKTGNALNIFKLTEGFMLDLQVSLIAGVLVGLPVVVYQIWKYIVPALEVKDRRFTGLCIVWAVALFYAGIFFAHSIMMPVVVNMFLGFTPPEMINTLGADRYLKFILFFALGTAAVFELPIVVLVLTRTGIVTPELLIRRRKAAIISIWVLAAIITPPDALTQIMLAIPLMLLYEISIIVSRIMLKRRKKKELEGYA